MKYRSSRLIKRERLIGLFSGCIVTMVSPLRGLGKMAVLIGATFSNRRDMFVRIMLFQQLSVLLLRPCLLYAAGMPVSKKLVSPETLLPLVSVHEWG